MKFALLIDKILHESFTVNDDGCFKIKTGEPYSHHSSIGNKTAFGVVSWPYVFKGDFIKLSEWDELPKNDYDVIIIIVEKFYDEYPISKIRKTYPNAVIIASMKEDTVFSYNYENAVKFYNDCDAVIFPFYKEPFSLISNIQNDVKKPIYSIAQPYNIKYLYNKFYKKNRNEMIFSYVATVPRRMASTESFAVHLGQEFKIPVLRKQIEFYPGRSQWNDFLEIFTPTTFNINCDPTPSQGHQGIQCAIFGIINIGGLTDSHKILFPETATQNLNVLENRVAEYLSNPQKRFEVIQYALNKLWEYYSYESAKKRLDNILKDLSDKL